MADTSYAYTPGSGGLASTDRIAGTDIPHYKIKWGPSGTAVDVDIAANRPLPIQLRTAAGAADTLSTVTTVTTLTGTTTLTPGVGATNLGKAFDAPAGATDTHVPTGAVRTDTPATLTPIVGDYVPLRVDSQGKLWCNIGAVVLGGGTANIGDVDVLSLPALPAGTAIIGQVGLDPASVDKGAGNATANTLRVTHDELQLGTLVNNSVPVITGGYIWQIVPANSDRQVLGGLDGGVGNYLETIVCVVTNPVASGVLLSNSGGGGTTPLAILPDGVAGGIGTYHIALGIRSTSAYFEITTHSGVHVIATGRWGTS